MRETPASIVRVAHVVTLTRSERSGAHEGAVNARLAALGKHAQVITLDHAGNYVSTPEGGVVMHSTLITYWTIDTTRTEEVDL